MSQVAQVAQVAQVDSIANPMWTMHEFAGKSIRMRYSDGYFNATDMCKIKQGKLMKDYLRNTQTKEFLTELEEELKINLAEINGEVGGNSPLPLVDIIGTGINENRGTWIHPKVAIHLAMWVSPKFCVKVIDWVNRFLQGDLTLVRDLVDRHDQLNESKSQVFIQTQALELQNKDMQITNLISNNNLLTEFKQSIQEQMNVLEEINKKLVSENERVKHLTCPYCNRIYSSVIGLTKHIRHTCDDNQKAKFRAVIDLVRFKTYVDLVMDKWDVISIHYDFTLERVDWSSNKPALRIKYTQKKYLYKIYTNASRIKFIKLLNTKFTMPMNLLLDDASSQSMDVNKEIHNLFSDYYEYGDHLFLDEFKAALGLPQE